MVKVACQNSVRGKKKMNVFTLPIPISNVETEREEDMKALRMYDSFLVLKDQECTSTVKVVCQNSFRGMKRMNVPTLPISISNGGTEREEDMKALGMYNSFSVIKDIE